MFEAIEEMWPGQIITGQKPAPKPEILNFINSQYAIEILYWALYYHKNIAIHCDVDVDGIGSGKILKQFISYVSESKQEYIINKEKQHGIQEKQVNYINTNGNTDLMVILDSSSNEIELIKKFKCHVLVIDHHIMNHESYIGKTDDGHLFIIVNNTINNQNAEYMNKWLREKNPNTNIVLKDYIANDEMSCGLVLYELLRLYSEAFRLTELLENLKLYQWAAVTLLTDAIPTSNDRNQWYMDKLVFSNDIEPSLSKMISSLNRYAYKPTKSLISYTFAPVVNKAIRAGASKTAMDIVLNFPERVYELRQYEQLQKVAMEIGATDYIETEHSVLRDLTDTGISRNYCGVIASSLVGTTHKNCAVYIVENGIAKGSFRGRLQKVDYHKYIMEFSPEIKAEGHSVAFGFEIPEKYIKDAMDSLVKYDESFDNTPYLTAGNLADKDKGKYHIDNFEDFRKGGGLYLLAIGNAKVSSDEQIMITVPATEATLVEIKGKLYVYEVLGVICKAFREITFDKFINIYIEMETSIEAYIK